MKNTLFLVSGGAKGITAECVVKLAQVYGGQYILLGRSIIDFNEPVWAKDNNNDNELKKGAMTEIQAAGGKPTPMAVEKRTNAILAKREVEGTLQAIKQAGGQAWYLSTDIVNMDITNLQYQISLITPLPITGIIHGAGALADKLIEKKTWQDFELVYSTKIKGLQNLLRCVSPEKLKYLILFSSVAGFYGNVGQTDYSLANEILNKSAYLFKKQYPTCHVVSMNWGPWDGGMVTPELKKAFADRGVEVIPIPVGTQILADELKNNGEVQVVVGSGLTTRLKGSIDTETLQTYRLHRRLSLDLYPFLNDHTIQKHAVLPMAFVIVWVSNVCEARFPGYRCSSFDNMQVFKGIVFDDTLADEYVLDLQEVVKNEHEIIIEGKIWSKLEHTLANKIHYTIKVRLVRSMNAKNDTEIDNKILKSYITKKSDNPYKTKLLFHGPVFQGVQNYNFQDESHVLMDCQLPLVQSDTKFMKDTKTLDVMLQGIVFWVGHFKQARSLPLECQHGEFYRDINFGEQFYVSINIKNITDMNLTADIDALDANGYLFARMVNAKVTISKQLTW